MKIFKTSFTVEFCHCDSARIVFYPHFYVWFDQATERMFKAMGYPYSTLQERFGLIGFPLLETGATYLNACKLGDQLSMQSHVDEFNEKTFLVKHDLYHEDGRLAVEGFERRIGVAIDEKSNKGLKATMIPDAILEQFACN